jgi:uncharacterized protein (DUF849 family)
MDTSAKGLRVLVTAGAANMTIEEIGLQVATPDEARQMLKLKGGRNVAC